MKMAHTVGYSTYVSMTTDNIGTFMSPTVNKLVIMAVLEGLLPINASKTTCSIILWPFSSLPLSSSGYTY